MEEFWQLFWESGAPEYYLLYCREQQKQAALRQERAARV